MLRRLNRLHILYGDEKLIATHGDFLHEKRRQHLINFNKEMLHFKVGRWVVGIDLDGHLPFQAVRLDDLAQIKTIFFFHRF